MRNTFIVGAAAAAALLLFGCGGAAKTDVTPSALRTELGAVAEELNAYLGEHNLQNTDAGEMQSTVETLAGKYGGIAKRATKLAEDTGDEEYGELGKLASEGADRAGALATALGAGPPAGDMAKATALHDAVAAWADYNDELGASSGDVAAPTDGDDAAPGTPGRGKHYGWWKNPEWANDPASREGDEAGVGTGEMDRERERERKRDGTGGGSGSGKGTGTGSGGGAGKGAGGGAGGGAGKGAGGGGGMGRGGE
jgi:hypothetical protein